MSLTPAEVEKRIDFLEKQEKEIESGTEKLKSQLDSELSSANDDIKKIKTKIQDLKSELDEINKLLVSLVKAFRQTASKTDAELLNKKVDAWGPDQFITKKEFSKLLNDS